MEEQKTSSGKTKTIILIILGVVLVLGLIISLVAGNDDSEPQQPPAETAPADDNAPAESGSPVDTNANETTTPAPDTTGTTDPTIVEAQALLAELKAVNQRMEPAVAACNQAAIASEEQVVAGLLTRLDTLATQVAVPTPEHNSLLEQLNGQLEINGQFAIAILTKCGLPQTTS